MALRLAPVLAAALAMPCEAADPQGARRGVVHAIAYDAAQLIFAGSCGGGKPARETRLCRLDLRTRQIERIPGFPHPKIRSLRALAFLEGVLHAGGRGGLVRRTKDGWEEVAALSGREVNGLAASSNILWAATDRGLFGLSGGKIVKSYGKTKPRESGFDTDAVFSVFEQLGTLYVGTYDPLSGEGRGLYLISLFLNRIAPLELPKELGFEPGKTLLARAFPSDKPGFPRLLLWQWGWGGVYDYDPSGGKFDGPLRVYEKGGWTERPFGDQPSEILRELEQLMDAPGARIRPVEYPAFQYREAPPR